MGMFDDAANKRKTAVAEKETKLKKSNHTSNISVDRDETGKMIVNTPKPVPTPDDNKLTKLTLSVSIADRKKAKLYAAEHDTSVSALFHKMVEELN